MVFLRFPTSCCIPSSRGGQRTDVDIIGLRRLLALVVHRSRSPLELLQNAASQYVTQSMTEKVHLVRMPLLELTVADGSITVAMRSPFDALAKAAGK